jgi:hypothetical protein
VPDPARFSNARDCSRASGSAIGAANTEECCSDRSAAKEIAMVRCMIVLNLRIYQMRQKGNVIDNQEKHATKVLLYTDPDGW